MIWLPMSDKTENSQSLCKSNDLSVREFKRPGHVQKMFITCSGDNCSGFIPARDLNSSVLKGIWWMPWQSEAMKDVAGCDKPRWEVNTLWPADVRMGKPISLWDIINWIHRLMKLTRGSETSQYPEEKKSTEIPLVVASERGSAQWSFCNK